MVGTSARVEVSRRDLGRLVIAATLLWRQWCVLPFDPDGVAVPDGERREGLRVTQGRHLAAGTRYALVFASDDGGPLALEVVHAEGGVVEYLVEQADMTCTVRLQDPQFPGDVHIGLRGDLGNVPLMGPEYTFTGSVYPAALMSGGRAADGEWRVKRLRVRTTVDVDVRETDCLVTVRVSGRPRGLLLPLLAAWPLLRAKATMRLADTVTEIAEKVRTTEDLAGHAWTEFVADIARQGRSAATDAVEP